MSGPIYDYEPPDPPTEQVEERLGWDTSVEWSEATRVQFNAMYLRLNEALAASEARVREVERERALAIAHDRQPYPTAAAYEKVCESLHKREAERDTALARVRELDAAIREHRRFTEKSSPVDSRLWERINDEPA